MRVLTFSSVIVIVADSLFYKCQAREALPSYMLFSPNRSPGKKECSVDESGAPHTEPAVKRVPAEVTTDEEEATEAAEADAVPSLPLHMSPPPPPPPEDLGSSGLEGVWPRVGVFAPPEAPPVPAPPPPCC